MAMLAVPAVEATAGRVAAAKTGKAATKKAAARKSSGSAAGRRGGKPKNLPSAGPDGVPPTGVSEQASADLFGGIGTGLKQLGSDASNRVTLTPPRKLSAGDASGFAFGLVAYCLFINAIKYGPAGVRGWIAAKFINKPLTGVTPK